MSGLGLRALQAGSLGGLAMVPVGVLLRLGGYPVNVYGQLLLQVLVGRAPVWALLVEHFLVSWALALPLLLVTVGRPRRALAPWLVAGVVYGTLIWTVLNSLALPFLFGQPTPWRIGWSAIWPSLLVHLVYGVVTAAAVRWLERL